MLREAARTENVQGTEAYSGRRSPAAPSPLPSPRRASDVGAQDLQQLVSDEFLSCDLDSLQLCSLTHHPVTCSEMTFLALDQPSLPGLLGVTKQPRLSLPIFSLFCEQSRADV